MRSFSSLLIGLFLFLNCTGLWGQRPHPPWQNYTPDDGLAASEVHYCLESPDGYMWFATDNGLSRFDGYTFKNYGVKEGLADPVVLYMQLDPRGVLWLTTISGKLFYFKQDKIYPFSGNEKIIDLLEESNQTRSIPNPQPKDFYIDAEDNKYLSYFGYGIIQITTQDSLIHHKPTGKTTGFFALDVGGRWISGLFQQHDPAFSQLIMDQYYDEGVEPPVEIRSDSVFHLDSLFSARNHPLFWIKEINKKLCLLLGNHLYELEKRAVKRVATSSFYFGEYKRVFEDKEGKLYLSLDNGKGLFRYSSYEEFVKGTLPDVLLPGSTPSHMYQDEQGNFWVTTTDKGVFVCNNLNWNIYDQTTGLSSNLVTSIAIKDTSQIFVGSRLGNIYLLNWKQDQATPLPKYKINNATLVDMVYHKGLDELWIGTSGSHFFFKEDKWDIVYHEFYYPKESRNKATPNVLMKNLSLQKNGFQLWGGGSQQFSGIDISKKKVIFYSFEKQIENTRTLVSYPTSGDTVWIGNVRGLFFLGGIQDSILRRPKPVDSRLTTRVEDLAELSDGSLVIASKGQGLLIKKGARLFAIEKRDGLTTNMIENVFVDERDNIWVGTLNGLNKISGFTWRDTNQFQIHQYTTNNNLPSNEINKVEVLGKEVWVATNNGLLHFTDQDSINTQSKTPILSKLIVNGTELPYINDTAFSHRHNNLSIHFLTINFPQNGNINYRYRLLPSQEKWIETKNRSVILSNLRDGTYTFEVQSQNEFGIWSIPQPFSFEIRPPFWRSGWFLSMIFLTIGFISYRLYKNRTSKLKQEAVTARQLAELERSALRAQMNPHFIFNSLNSISNFINKGDKREANHYLATFAKLIRGILNHSRAERISLESELQLINNYLKLEQLRFGGRLEYQIDVAENVEPFEIEMPPMIVQPFLENAIIHGLSRKTETGKIKLDYQLQNGYLKVTITDNGIGITASKAAKTKSTKGHKSVGMTITQHRLELISSKSNQGRFETKELLGEDGKVEGTQVVVWIPLGQ